MKQHQTFSGTEAWEGSALRPSRWRLLAPLFSLGLLVGLVVKASACDQRQAVRVQLAPEPTPMPVQHPAVMPVRRIGMNDFMGGSKAPVGGLGLYGPRNRLDDGPRDSELESQAAEPRAK